MIKIAKYQKKPVIVDAEPFKMGMEDGYACYSIGGEFTGHFDKHGGLPRNNRKPAIKTLEGWYEVQVDKHYIVTGIKGERYPVEATLFHEKFVLVEDSKENTLLTLPGNSSIFGTENLEYLLEKLRQRLDNSESEKA